MSNFIFLKTKSRNLGNIGSIPTRDRGCKMSVSWFLKDSGGSLAGRVY